MRILPIVSGTRLPVGVRPVGRSLVKQKSCVKNFDTAFLLYKALKFNAKDVYDAAWLRSILLTRCHLELHVQLYSNAVFVNSG